MSWESICARLPQQFRSCEVVRVDQGSDHNVFTISIKSPLTTNSKGCEYAIVRVSSPTKFAPLPMHSPKTASRFMYFLDEHVDSSLSFYFPHPLYFSNDDKDPLFLIESHIDGINLASYEAPVKLLQESANIKKSLAKCIAGLHSIKTAKYGPLSAEIPCGQYESWGDVFTNFPARLEKCGKMLPAMHQSCLQRYNDIVPFLNGFDSPMLVHSDICGANIRIQFDSALSEWTLTGIIDFGDVMSGDPLYDFGRFLSHLHGNWQIIHEIYEYYQAYRMEIGERWREFSKDELQRLQFYALSFSVWMWSTNDNGDHIAKYESIITSLLSHQ